jgi:hypothetical protein
MTEPVGERQMPSSPLCCPVVELRQYTPHPGQRDVLIDLFDREFVETQEVLGMKVIGQFRDLDWPRLAAWEVCFQIFKVNVHGTSSVGRQLRRIITITAKYIE